MRYIKEIMNKEEILNTFLLANIPEIITQEEFDVLYQMINSANSSLENTLNGGELNG